MPRKNSYNKCKCGGKKGVDSEVCRVCHLARQKKEFRIPPRRRDYPAPMDGKPMKRYRSGK